MAILKRYLVGSKYFFGNLPGFESKDTDWLVIEDKRSVPYKHLLFIRGKTVDEFRVLESPADLYIDGCLEIGLPMAIGKFLNKEFCEDAGITISHLERLKDLAEKMDEKHLYVKYIYDKYLEHQDFILTDKELKEAYNIYQKYKETIHE